jgi:hypothetical protein|tara:strand:- start:4517 stop:4723 length:207 start_codon:yes stop_codon:yes gene_type:complete
MQYTLRGKTDGDNYGYIDLWYITAPTPKDALLKALLTTIPEDVSFRLYDAENNEMVSAFEVEGEVRDA